MKYIKLFKNDAEYQAFKGGEDYVTPNLCSIGHKLIINYKTNPLMNIAGTAVVYDMAKQSLMAIAGENYNTTDYPQDLYSPVGVVIMPANHSTDGKARIMSTKFLGFKKENEEIICVPWDKANMNNLQNVNLYHCLFGDGSQSLNNYQFLIYGFINEHGMTSSHRVPIINQPNNNIYDAYSVGDIVDINTSPFSYYTNFDISSTFAGDYGMIKQTENVNSEFGWCAAPASDPDIYNGLFLPSPYNIDGSINQNVRFTNSIMEDIDSHYLRDLIISKSENDNSQGFLSTILACNKYTTNGTKEKDWFLPTSLELAYISARAKEIFSTMKKINANFISPYDVLIGLEDSNVIMTYACNLTSVNSTTYTMSGLLPVNIMADSDVYTYTNFLISRIPNNIL